MSIDTRSARLQAEREAAELAAKRAELEEEVARARAAAAQLPTILGFKEATRSKRSGRNRDEKLARRRARCDTPPCPFLCTSQIEPIPNAEHIKCSGHRHSHQQHALHSSALILSRTCPLATHILLGAVSTCLGGCMYFDS